MSGRVALLRGVNLGPHRKVSPAALKAVAQRLGLGSPRTLINSGNLVFQSESEPATLETALHDAIAAETSVRSDIYVRTDAEWWAMVAANPYPEVEDGTRLTLTVLRADIDAATLDSLRAHAISGEALTARPRALYARLPFGQAASKLAERLTKLPGTARNWNTVIKLAAMLDG